MKILVLSLSLVCSCAIDAGGQTAPVCPAVSAPAVRTVVRTLESVTVTADRGLFGVNDAASSVNLISQQQIQQRSGFALDDALRTVAGFQLFRRSSSWTANPTSQGLSLRGLGSTAASRTLVVSDQVPLNDPFGGWVHWNEIPLLAIDHVEVLRGGAADLYGSSAIGGVLDVVPLTATSAPKVRISADAAGGSEDTAQEDGLLTVAGKHLAMLAAASGLRTNGYIPTAPIFRGAVDAPSNVTGESGRFELRTPLGGASGSAFLRGNVLNEARRNGSVLQTNGTRLWRYQGGADALSPHWGRGVARAYGSRESYRQSFSAIAQNRNSERLTRLQRVPTDEFGGVVQGSRAFFGNITASIGADLRDIRATDNESSVVANVVTVTQSTSARQREVGGYADAIWQPDQWSLSGSVRVDSFRTFDAQQAASNSGTVVLFPSLNELVVSPHLGLVRRLPRGVALTASAFRAFRGPSMNELYRTGQVGQQMTLPNASLLAERATGLEFGGEVARPRLGSLRATYFWTEVNRPVSAVLLRSTATTQTLQRQNLGQIRSRGLMFEAQSQTWHGLSGTVSYQFAVATVTRFNTLFAAQKNLRGNWIPQVPRQAVATQLRYDAPRIALFSAMFTYNGQQFDDAENLYVLHAFARMDVFAERSVGHDLSVYASAQNVLNRAIEAGRTPVLTLAAPRVVQAGIRYHFSR